MGDCHAGCLGPGSWRRRIDTSLESPGDIVPWQMAPAISAQGYRQRRARSWCCSERSGQPRARRAAAGRPACPETGTAVRLERENLRQPPRHAILVFP
jgi:hypothetical protein